jgi:hypothetical protein
LILALYCYNLKTEKMKKYFTSDDNCNGTATSCAQETTKKKVKQLLKLPK